MIKTYKTQSKIRIKALIAGALLLLCSTGNGFTAMLIINWR